MRVLITRPEAEAQMLQQALQACGITADCAPLLAIRIHRDVPLPLDGVAALLFTSANGVRAFAANAARRDFSVFAVGEASAAAARAAGFADVQAAGGDVDSLAALVQARWRPQDGILLHAAGATLAGDLQALLQAQDYTVRRIMLYTAEAATALPAPVAAAFAMGIYDAVLFFSPRTAATFVTLVRAAGCAGGATAAVAACLSANVAQAVAELPWRAVQVAARPREADLLSLPGVGVMAPPRADDTGDGQGTGREDGVEQA